MKTTVRISKPLRLVMVFLLFTTGFLLGCPSNPYHDMVREAVRASRKGDNEKAIRIYDEIIEKGGFQEDAYDRGVVFYNRALAWYELGNYQKSIEDYTLAYETRPKCLVCLHNRSVVYEKMGDISKAITDIERMLEAEPNDEDAQKRLDYLKAKLKTG